jgi:DNA-binding phage protein
VSALARENGITEQTLYTWRRQLKAQGVPTTRTYIQIAISFHIESVCFTLQLPIHTAVDASVD